MKASTLLLVGIGLLLTACDRGPGPVPDIPESAFSTFNPQAAESLQASLARWQGVDAEAPEAPERAVDFAEIALAYERADWALEALDWALALRPDNGAWSYLRAHAQKALGQDEEARAAMRTAMEQLPFYSAARIHLAQWTLEAGQPEAAADLFAGRRVPQDNEAAWLAVWGRVALAQEKHAQAAELLRDALEADPSASQLNYPLGLALRALGQTDAAEAALAARGEDPPRLEDALMAAVDERRIDPHALRTRGSEIALAGDHVRAVELYRQSLALQDDLETRVNLGISQLRSGDPIAAEATLRGALSMAGDHARAWFALGTLMAGQGRDLEAIDAYRKALEQDPDQLDARFNLANALRRSGDFRDAALAYEAVLERDPARAPAWVGLIDARIRLGDWRAADDAAERALAFHPDDANLLVRRSRLLAGAPDEALRDPDRALELAQALFDAEVTLPNGEALAMALAASGRYLEAAALQQRLIDSARSANRSDLVPALEAALDRYSSGRPWRLDLD